MVTVTLHITDDALGTSNDLEDVVVRFYSEDGTTFVTQAQTDSAGGVVLDLEDKTTYWVRFFKIGYQFRASQLISVDSDEASNTFDVTGNDLTTLPPSTVPELCRVGGYVVGPDLTPRAGVAVTFSLTGKPRIVAGLPMVIQDLTATSDSEGWVEVELVRKGVYDCVVAGQDDMVNRVIVPDRSSAPLTEVVWPYVRSLRYLLGDDEVTALSLKVGESATLTVEVELSSGVTTPYDVDSTSSPGGPETIGADYYLTFSFTSGSDAVSASFSGGDTVTILASKAGVAVIAAAVRDLVEVERLPAPSRSLPLLTITVTE